MEKHLRNILKKYLPKVEWVQDNSEKDWYGFYAPEYDLILLSTQIKSRRHLCRILVHELIHWFLDRFTGPDSWDKINKVYDERSLI